MNWIGQHIVSLIARFRSDVYLEDISTGTIASGSHLGLDSNNKIVKAVDGGGDLTSIVAGTGLSGTSLTGPIPTLNVDASQTQITAVGTIGTGTWRADPIATPYIADDAITEDKLANTLLAEIDANTAKVTNSDQSKSDIDALGITTVGTIDTGAWNGDAIASAYLDPDTAHLTTAQTFTGSKTMGTDVKLNFRDANSTISSPTANDLEIAATDITLDAAGGIFMEASDVTMFDPVDGGNPSFSIGANSGDRFVTTAIYNGGAQTLDSVAFQTFTTSTGANDGRYIWYVDEVELARLLDDGLLVYGYVNSIGDGAFVQTRNTTASSATEGGKLKLVCDDGAAMGDDHRLGVIEFQGAEDASSNRQTGASIQAMCDAAWSASENGTRLEFYTMDGNASSELSLTLDSDLLATFAGAATITGLTTLSGNLTFDSVALTGIQTSAESFVDNDTSLMTSAAINDAIIKGGNTTTIKVLPYQFMQNEEGGVNKSVQFDQSGTIGVKSTSADGELFAFVEIPIGKTATSVTVYGNDTNNVVQVYNLNIDASAALGTTDGSGNNITNSGGCVVGTACDIVDTDATATNYLVIEVTVIAISDIVYGAVVTISG